MQADGAIDEAFGEMGAVISSFGLSSEDPELASGSTASVLDGVVDSHDRPVLLVGVAGRFSPCLGHSEYASFPRGMVRLMPAGAADPTFGGGDGLSPLLRDLNTVPRPELAVTDADQPMAVGSRLAGCPRGSLVFRLSEKGELSPTYGSSGQRYFPYGRFGVFGAFAASGAIILRTGSPVASKVVRVKPTGSIDRTFGRRGFAPVGMPRGTNRSLRPVAVDSRGRILMLGSYSRAIRGRHEQQAFLIVERILRSGALDPSFGARGVLTTPVPAAQALGDNEAELDPQGRLVVLSEVKRRSSGSDAPAILTRFRLRN
jgi:hypothetical protein